MTNNVDPDQTPHYAASDQGLYCLLMHMYLVLEKNTVAEYKKFTCSCKFLLFFFFFLELALSTLELYLN